MRIKKTNIWIGLLLAILVFITCPAGLQAQQVFITIGGGDFSGVYFPTGLAIAKLLNSKREIYGIRATVEATSGTTFNLNAIMAGYLEFGLAQSDAQYRAFNGLAEWAKKGPQKELRAVFSLHHETVTLVGAVDAGIRTIADLKGKVVSTGNPGSSQHRIVMDALKAAGLDPKRDFTPFRVMASEVPALLQDSRIDGFFFTVGHPSEVIQRALSGNRKARIIPISGPAIDKLIADNSFYIKSSIPVKRLYPGVGDQADVATLGVIATLCTSAKMPEDVVYALTKEVFENLEALRWQNPAFYHLTKQGMLDGLSAPLHPGALRYFKETGMIP